MENEEKSSARDAGEAHDVVLRLEDFLPYQLSIASNTISGGIAALYAERFSLSIPEWRIMAVVGRFDGLSAREVSERTAMDKVAVSRALKRLQEAGHIDRCVSPEDRRRSVLSLTGSGRVIYNQVAPMALDYEKRLLAGLSEEQRQSLSDLLDRLRQRALDMS